MTIQLKHIALANCLLLLVLISINAFAGKPPPNINQCKGKWVLTNGTPLSFGAYSIDSGSGSLSILSSGILTTSGDIGVASTPAASAYKVTVDNTRGSTCAGYGFNLNWGGGAPPQPLVNGATSMVLTAYVYEPTIASAPNTTLSLTVPPGTGLTLPFTLTIYGSIPTTFPQAVGTYTSPVFDVELVQSGTTSRPAAGLAATVTSLAPISLQQLVSMNFGTVAGSSTASTIVLDTASARSVTGGGQIIATDPGTAATFQISGSGNRTYILSTSASATLEKADGTQIILDTFTNNSLGTIPAGGIETFQMGGTLHLNATQPAGVYSTTTGTGSPYTLTVNYN